MTEEKLAELRAQIASAAPGPTRRVLELAEEVLAADLSAREGLDAAVAGALAAFEALVGRLRAGEDKLYGALIGRVRKLLGGKGDPGAIRAEIDRQLGLTDSA